MAQAADTLDFTQPTAILLLAIVHFLSDSDGPAEIVARLASALAPGSYLAISHLTGDFAPEQVTAATTAYNTLAPVSVTARTHAQVTAELARRWKLPQRLIDGFANAPEPLDARPFSLLAAVLNMAAVMSDSGAMAVAPGEALAQANTPLLEHLRLDVPWLQSRAPNFEELTASVDELLA